MSRKLDKKIHEKLFGGKVKEIRYFGGYLVRAGGKDLKKPKPEYEYTLVTNVEDTDSYLYEDFSVESSFIVANRLPYYSSSMKDVELVINKMREKGWKILEISEMENNKWNAGFWYDDVDMTIVIAIGKTLPKAVCNATLKALCKKIGKRRKKK